MKLRGNTCRATWVNLSGLRGELLQKVRVQVVHLGKRHVETSAWHLAVGAAKVHRALFCFRSNHKIVWLSLPVKGLALLAMQGASLEVGIKLHFFQSARSAKTLLVSCGNIDRGTGAFFFGFRAFKDNNVSGHDWASLRVFREGGKISRITKFLNRNFIRRLKRALRRLFRRGQRGTSQAIDGCLERALHRAFPDNRPCNERRALLQGGPEE